MSDPPWPGTGLAGWSLEDIARHAEQLLGDPVLATVLNDMDSDTVRTWKEATSPGQREECWHKISVIAEMRRRLERAIEDYKLKTDRERRKAIKRD